MECITIGRVSKKRRKQPKSTEADGDGTRPVDVRLNALNVVRRCCNEQRVIRIIWKVI